MPASSLEQPHSVLGFDDLQTDQSKQVFENEFSGIAQGEVEGLVAWSEQSRSNAAELRIVDELFSTEGAAGVRELLRAGLQTSHDHARCDELFSDFELLRVEINKSCS